MESFRLLRPLTLVTEISELLTAIIVQMAAMKAGASEVPVNVTTVSPEEAAQLQDDAAIAKAERMNRCLWRW